MKPVNTAQTLDSIALQMPVQWCFKLHSPSGMRGELLLRRVKSGNETTCAQEDKHDSLTHFKGRFSDAQTLQERLDDPTLPDGCDWIAPSVEAILSHMALAARHNRALLQLFSPKGKIELYPPSANYFTPQYISGNFTLKIHADDLASHHSPNLFVHLIAQHLNYPFGPGERRFSTSRLFDLCFTAEKIMTRGSLAERIDASLTQRGILQPTRHLKDERAHVRHLVHGGSAAIRTSYERVLQRERFAELIVALYGSKPVSAPSPLLGAYKQLIEVDLCSHQQADFKDYPPKGMDAIAEHIHLPLLMMLSPPATNRKAS